MSGERSLSTPSASLVHPVSGGQFESGAVINLIEHESRESYGVIKRKTEKGKVKSFRR